MNNAEIEKIRSLRLKASISLAILLISLLLLVILFMIDQPIPAFVSVGVCVISFIFTVIWSKKCSVLFKENIVRLILKESFEELVFESKRGISEEIVYSTGMIKRGDRYSSNDLITGKYNGVSFTQSDVCIEEETHDSDGGTSTSTLFKGRWMIFDFNKEFRSDLQVVSKHFFSARKKGGLFSGEPKMAKVELENEEFNKQFKVYAADEHEVFYILTPHIMESLIKFKDAVNAPIMLAFTGGSLHVAVANNKDAFEISYFGKFDVDKEIGRIKDEIKIITDFSDALSLEKDIYKY